MEQLFGIIREDATVLADDGTVHKLPVRGTDKDGYKQVLIDATEVDGDGEFTRQSIRPYVGMRVEFTRIEYGLQGFNYKIIK